MTQQFIVAQHPADYAMAARLFEEYAAQLGVDLCFQGFAAELADLPSLYGAPRGHLLLAMHEGVAVGCGALRESAAAACEMKRLYIRPAHRGAHLGRHMAERLIAAARALGYSRMRLDTLAGMSAARRLYASLGFRETAPYYENPLGGVFFMELPLDAAPPSVGAHRDP